MDYFNVQCKLHGRIDIDSFLWTPHKCRETERKNKSSQVVIVITPMRGTSKNISASPIQDPWNIAAVSGGESDVMIL